MAGEKAPLLTVVENHGYIKPEDAPISPEPDFGGGKGGGPMDPSVSMKDHLDARDAALESRLGAKLDKLPSEARMWGMVVSILGGTFVLFVGFLAVLSFAGDRFDGGMSVSPAIAAVQQNQAQVDQRQDAQMAIADRKLDIIIQQTASK